MVVKNVANDLNMGFQLLFSLYTMSFLFHLDINCNKIAPLLVLNIVAEKRSTGLVVRGFQFPYSFQIISLANIVYTLVVQLRYLTLINELNKL